MKRKVFPILFIVCGMAVTIISPGTILSRDVQEVGDMGSQPGTIQRSTIVNVKEFGARGDGITDDTASINLAKSAVGEGGTLFFPNGHFVFSTLVFKLPINIVGEGWSYDSRPSFGSAKYPASLKGTYLRSTLNSGTSITLGPDVFDEHIPFKVADIAFLGPGAGSSTGVLLQNTVSGVFDNVGIFNFHTDMKLNMVEDYAFYSLHLYGSDVCFSSTNKANNQNSFFQLEMNNCVVGINATGGTGNVFYGGLVQGTVGSIGLNLKGVNNWTFDGLWFEDSFNQYAIKLTGSDSNQFYNLQLSGNSNVDLSASSNHNSFVNVKANNYKLTIDKGSTGTLLYRSHFNVIDASSTTTQIGRSTYDSLIHNLVMDGWPKISTPIPTMIFEDTTQEQNDWRISVDANSLYFRNMSDGGGTVKKSFRMDEWGNFTVLSGRIDIKNGNESSGKLFLWEDLDNGNNYVNLAIPANIASNRTITIPDASGTILVDNLITATPTSSEPERIEGAIAYADSANWNPGFGKGLYVFTGSNWEKLH